MFNRYLLGSPLVRPLVSPLVSLLVSFLISVNLAWAGAYDDALIAAREGRIDVLTALLQRGLDVNTAERDGTTLLGVAARNNNLAMVDMLIANRASPNRRNNYGDTPVLLAASQGKTDIVKHLVAAGAEINAPGWTPLHYAVYGGHAELAEYLLAAGADVERRAPNQRTTLMIAAQVGNLPMSKLLVQHGAKVSAVDSEGKTALDIALSKDFAHVADYLRTVKPLETQAQPSPEPAAAAAPVPEPLVTTPSAQ